MKKATITEDLNWHKSAFFALAMGKGFKSDKQKNYIMAMIKKIATGEGEGYLLTIPNTYKGNPKTRVIKVSEEGKVIPYSATAEPDVGTMKYYKNLHKVNRAHEMKNKKWFRDMDDEDKGDFIRRGY